MWPNSTITSKTIFWEKLIKIDDFNIDFMHHYEHTPTNEFLDYARLWTVVGGQI